MPVIIDGTALSKKIKTAVAVNTAQLIEKYHDIPHLVVILAGDDPASQSYVRGKEKACANAGIKSTVLRFPVSVTQSEIENEITRLNNDSSVHGILVQLPLPKSIDEVQVLSKINPKKDVDGFTPTNVSALFSGKPKLVPCTPQGIMHLLKEYEIPIEGAACVVLGRSQIVGKPMANLLLNANGTVTICHSRTKNLKNVTSQADILVVAVGKPLMIDDSYIKQGATVIDVGISRVNDKITGDVDYEKAFPKCAFITPVPGGVGPMTIACLLENTLKCYNLLHGDMI